MTSIDPTPTFFAYPSRPPALAECVQRAIEVLGTSGYLQIQDWQQLKTSGTIVIDEICQSIEHASLLLAEVTHLNPNVLFEIGFAVGRNKRIWLALDSSYPGASSDYRQVKALTTIGYAEYTNASELSNAILRDQPFVTLDQTIYSSVIAPLIESTPRSPRILYLKSPVDTEASSSLSRVLVDSGLPLATDDPGEIPIQTLDWYCEQLVNSFGVIVHLLDDERSPSAPIHNAKYSFISGLAYGLNLPLLMLAHDPFQPPFDYQDLLFVHKTATDCVNGARPWIEKVAASYDAEMGVLARGKAADKSAILLRRIFIGDYIAENEQYDLGGYFLETAAYTDAVHATQSMIYVGRKGTGKTANLYQISDKLSQDPSNHVVILKPVDYDLDGVLQLLRVSTPVAEQGFLMESLWKYLVYTQMALSYCQRLAQQPVHVQQSEGEIALLRFVEDHPEFVQPDFTLRLGTAVSQLCDIQYTADAAANRVKVSEILHAALLAQLRAALGQALSDMNRVYVLVDNLDKAWRLKPDLPPLSEFIFGLTSVSRAISEEFQRTGPTWRAVDVTVLVFLRSDIFSYVMSHAREVDKLVWTTIDWSDSAMLRRVIEERFRYSLRQPFPPDVIWDRFFAQTVGGVPTPGYMLSRVLPRPRDIIYLAKSALARAVNRAHARIEEEDLLLAEKDYSQYAFLTLLSEARPQYPYAEEFLVELAGAPDILTRNDIESALIRARLDPGDATDLIPLLMESLFLAPEVDIGQFRFLYDLTKAGVISSLARSTSERTGYQRYRIHPAFSKYLELS